MTKKEIEVPEGFTGKDLKYAKKLIAERPGPKPTLKLCGEDGNAFVILGMASRVAKKNNMDWDKISLEAMSGGYDHLLQTMIKYFDVV